MKINNQWIPFLILVFMLSAGCRTPQIPTPLNLEDPGWNVQRGQAIWHQRDVGSDLVVEVIFAKQDEGPFFLQVNKETLILSVVHGNLQDWEINMPMERRQLKGSGPLPAHHLWGQLASVLAGRGAAGDWTWNEMEGGGMVLDQGASGDRVEVFLEP